MSGRLDDHRFAGESKWILKVVQRQVDTFDRRASFSSIYTLAISSGQSKFKDIERHVLTPRIFSKEIKTIWRSINELSGLCIMYCWSLSNQQTHSLLVVAHYKLSSTGEWVDQTFRFRNFPISPAALQFILQFTSADKLIYSTVQGTNFSVDRKKDSYD